MVSVRKGNVQDIAACARLVFDATSARLGKPFSSETLSELFLNRIRNNAILIIAEEIDSIVGAAWATQARIDETDKICEGRAHVSHVAVAPGHWRKGIGSKVMHALLEELVLCGYKSAQLWTETNNERAIAFYTRLGFTATNRFYKNEKNEVRELYEMTLKE